MRTLGFRSILLGLASAVATQLGCGDDDGNGRPGAEDSSTTSDPSTSMATDEGPSSGAADDSDGGTGSGTDDTASTGPDSVGDDTTETGAPTTCDTETHVCVAQPEGWNGPVAVIQAGSDEEPPTCDSVAYPDQVLERNLGLVAPEADCQCTCAASTDAECETEAMLTYYGTGATCEVAPMESYFIFSQSCNFLSPTIPVNGRVMASAVPVVSGTCEPALSEAVAEASFTARVLACGGANLVDTGCSADRVCAPQPPQDTALCVWQDGENECPAEYPTRRLSFAEIEDGRSCSGCSCGPAQGLCDGASITLRATSGVPCQGATTRIVPAAEECVATSNSTSATGTLVVGEPTAFCDPSGGEPLGEAVGTEPVTICCLESGA